MKIIMKIGYTKVTSEVPTSGGGNSDIVKWFPNPIRMEISCFKVTSDMSTSAEGNSDIVKWFPVSIRMEIHQLSPIFA